jgi:hypothetical protein
MSAEQQKKFFPKAKLKDSSVILRTYSAEQLPVLGEMNASVTYGSQRKELPLLVVEGHGPNLLGRDWLLQLRLNWREIASTSLNWLAALITFGIGCHSAET